MTGITEIGQQYQLATYKYDRIAQLNANDRDIFHQQGYDLPQKVDVNDFFKKVCLFEVTMCHSKTLTENRLKKILFAGLRTFIAVTCLVLLIAMVSAPFIFGFEAIFAYLLLGYVAGAFICCTSYWNVKDLFKEKEMQKVYSDLGLACQLDSPEELEERIDEHEPRTSWISSLSLLNCLIPFVYLYQACTAASGWKKVLENQKKQLAILIEENDRLLIENRNYCGAHFRELVEAYFTKVQDAGNQRRVHTILDGYHKRYTQDLAEKVASIGILPDVLNNIVIDYS